MAQSTRSGPYHREAQALTREWEPVTEGLRHVEPTADPASDPVAAWWWVEEIRAHRLALARVLRPTSTPGR